MTDASQPAPELDQDVDAAGRDADRQLEQPDGPDVPLTDHAPAKNETGPEQRGGGGSG